jgi:hypothetical protein
MALEPVGFSELGRDGLVPIEGGTNWFNFWQDTAFAVAGVATVIGAVAAPEVVVPALIAGSIEYGAGTAGMIHEYF